MSSKNQYVRVLSNNENSVSLEYLPSGQVLTISKSYLDRLPLEGALKIMGVT